MLIAHEKNDEGWGWVVVAGAFCAHAITYGIIYSFGILFIALEERFDGSKTEIAWIPSLTTGLLHSSGLLASILVNKFGCRIVTIAGGITCSIGYILSMFAPNVYYLYVTMGIIAGCGFGTVFMPAVLIVTQYFTRLRAVACGIALSGCGIGVFIFSPVLKLLLDNYSLKGTLLILSGITLNYIPCGLVFLPLSQTQRKSPDTKYDKRDDGPNETDTLMNQKGPSDLATDEVHLDEEETGRSSCSCQQTKPVKQHNGEKALKDNNDAEEIVKICDLNKDVGDDLIIIEQSNKNQMARKSTSILTNYLVLLKRGEFLLFFVSQFLFIFGFYLPFVFLPDKAKGLGISESSSAWVASVFGIFSITGRIILGYIADRPSGNRLLMFKINFLITGLSTSLCPVLNSLWLMMVYSAVFGVSAGFTISVTSVVVLDLVGLECLTEALGLISLSSGIGSMLGPPFGGLLYDTTGSYTAPFLASGASMAFGAILVIIMPFINKIKI